MKRPDLFMFGKEYIASMEELILRYREAIKLGIKKCQYETNNDLQCLLCHPIGISEEIVDAAGCDDLGCPWSVVLGYHCRSSIYDSKDPIILRRRIRQLQNWIKIYKKYMEV